ncbi:MAG: hypothetical protein ACLRFN_02310, partial [Alphaproteobacteria bacterium]
MRKFLVGAILGALVADNAGASLISRSFLDQALTDYATNTALDLKANQSDFTELNTQISDSVDVLRDLLKQNSSSYEFVNGINPEKFPNTISGAFGLLYQYLDRFAGSILLGWTDSKGTSYAGFADLNNGWTDSEGNTYLGVKGLNDKIDSIETKIDTLPTSRINSFTAGEQNAEIMDFLATKNLPVTYPRTLARFMYEMYDIYLHTMFAGWTDTTGKEYGGLIDLNNQIGTLPRGDMRTSKGLVYLLPDPEYYTYPTSIGDFMGQMYGGYLGVSGLAEAVYFGNEFMGQTDTRLQVKGLRQITDEIGTLPTEIPNIDSTWARYGFVETPGTPIDLPDTIGEMFAMLFNEDGLFNGLSLRNIMTKILLGFNGIEGLAPLTSAYKLVGDSPIVTAVNANTAKIGTVPDGKNLAGMISETDAKIGTLPTEYAKVGAALTAIKGIAEDAKAAALAAIPDPKTEGSTGKFVLTVDI